MDFLKQFFVKSTSQNKKVQENEVTKSYHFQVWDCLSSHDLCKLNDVNPGSFGKSNVINESYNNNHFQEKFNHKESQFLSDCANGISNISCELNQLKDRTYKHISNTSDTNINLSQVEFILSEFVVLINELKSELIYKSPENYRFKSQLELAIKQISIHKECSIDDLSIASKALENINQLLEKEYCFTLIRTEIRNILLTILTQVKNFWLIIVPTFFKSKEIENENLLISYSLNLIRVLKRVISLNTDNSDETKVLIIDAIIPFEVALNYFKIESVSLNTCISFFNMGTYFESNELFLALLMLLSRFVKEFSTPEYENPPMNYLQIYIKYICRLIDMKLDSNFVPSNFKRDNLLTYLVEPFKMYTNINDGDQDMGLNVIERLLHTLIPDSNEDDPNIGKEFRSISLKVNAKRKKNELNERNKIKKICIETTPQTNSTIVLKQLTSDTNILINMQSKLQNLVNVTNNLKEQLKKEF